MGNEVKWLLVVLILLTTFSTYQQQVTIKGFDTLIHMTAAGKPNLLYGYNEEKESWSRLRIDGKNQLICSLAKE